MHSHTAIYLSCSVLLHFPCPSFWHVTHTHTQHNPPHFPVSLHSLACSALSSLDHIFSVPYARIFSNTTKLVGISCLCVLSHRNILQKIKGTSFKWGEKVGRGESWEPQRVCVCVCVCLVFWTHYYCQEEIAVHEEVKWRNQRDPRCQ